MREQATYVSIWEEGIVQTKCTIVDGKYITDIEQKEDCDHLENLVEECVIYRGEERPIDTETMTLLE